MDIDRSLICKCNDKLYSDWNSLVKHQETVLHKNNMKSISEIRNELENVKLNKILDLILKLTTKVQILESKIELVLSKSVKEEEDFIKF